MKIITLLFLVISTCFAQIPPKYVTLIDGDEVNGQNGINIDEGYQIEILGIYLKTGDEEPSNPSDPRDYSFVDIQGDEASSFGFHMFFNSENKPPQNFIFLSPASIDVNSAGGSNGFAMINLKITKIEETNSIPTNTVVIPSDASGTVNIILEQSEDLVNWTAANPGSYGSSTVKRFFRVRAENQ